MYRYKQHREKGGAAGFSMHGENYIETHWEKHVCHSYKTARRIYIYLPTVECNSLSRLSATLCQLAHENIKPIKKRGESLSPFLFHIPKEETVDSF